MFDEGKGFKIGIGAILIILLVVFWLGQDSGKAKAENKIYKQIVESQLVESDL